MIFSSLICYSLQPLLYYAVHLIIFSSSRILLLFIIYLSISPSLSLSIFGTVRYRINWRRRAYILQGFV
jgi:hypothetical protein